MRSERATAAAAVLVGAALGVYLAACGAAPQKAAPEPAMAGGLDARGGVVDEIDALDAAIARDLAALGEAPPTDAEVTEAMVAHEVPALPMTDAAADACPAAPSGAACADVCTLADAICDNAGRICALADELGGDPHATQRCAAGRLACARALARCCTCPS